MNNFIAVTVAVIVMLSFLILYRAHLKNAEGLAWQDQAIKNISHLLTPNN